MAINRAPFNALVDDDGTGTTGTPWNKQAIKNVILDPVDAVIAALPPIPPAAPLTLLGSGSGSSTNPAATVVHNVPIPQVTLTDQILVSIGAINIGAPAPIPLLLRVYDGNAAAFQNLLLLTGTTGAGDLVLNNLGTWRVAVRSAPPDGYLEANADGIIAGVSAQTRGWAFGGSTAAWWTRAPGNVIYLQSQGVPAGGTLYWAWSVHLLKG